MSENIDLSWARNLKEYALPCVRAYRRTAIYLVLLFVVDVLSLKAHGLMDIVISGVELVLMVPVTFATIKEVDISSLKEEAPESLKNTQLTQSVFLRLLFSSLILVLATVPYPVLLAVVDLMSNQKYTLGGGIVLGGIAFLCSAMLPIIVWWCVKSSLGYVFICIENEGIINSFRRSHQLADGHFWVFLRYLATNFFVVLLPCSVLTMNARHALKQAMESGHPANFEFYGFWVALFLLEAINATLPMGSILIQSMCLYRWAQDLSISGSKATS